MNGLKPTPTFTWNENLLSQNVICHFWQKGEVALHSHTFYEFFLVTEGRVIHTYGGKDEVISSGTLYLITPGHTHKFMRYCGEDTVHFNMKLSPELYLALSNIVSSELCNKIKGEAKPLKYIMQDYELEYFKKTFESLPLRYAEKTEELTLSLLRCTAMTFLGYINLALGEENNSHPVWFSEFLGRICKEESLSLPLSEIYKFSPYSQTRLNHYFHKFMGETLISYITKRRISFACNLLRSSDSTVLAVSERCGFNNLSNFNRAFKRTLGKTPTEYRKSFSEKYL